MKKLKHRETFLRDDNDPKCFGKTGQSSLFDQHSSFQGTFAYQSDCFFSSIVTQFFLLSCFLQVKKQESGSLAFRSCYSTGFRER